MTSLLLIIIYLAFISLGLPDSLLGVSLAQYVPGTRGFCFLLGSDVMIIAAGTIVSVWPAIFLTP